MTGRIAAAAAVLYAARRYYRNWGTTKEDCQLTLPGDELTHRPSVRSTEGIGIDAPAPAVWPWVIRVGRAPHGLRFHHRNTHQAGPEGRPLAPGDTVAVAPRGWPGRRETWSLTVDRVVDADTLVLRGSPPDFPWEAVWSFHLLPRGDDRCRLLARTRAGLRHPGEVLLVEMAGPVVALATRRLLRQIKCAAERQVTPAAQPEHAALPDR